MSDRLTQWLAILANLYGPYRAEAAQVFKTYAPMLNRDFTPDAFTGSSAAHVARQCPSVPTYGKLCAALAEWWQDNRPRAVALPPPAPEPWAKDALTEETRAAAIAAVKAKYADQIEAFTADTKPPPSKPGHLARPILAASYQAAGMTVPAYLKPHLADAEP
jgi:hypothetical protein